MRFRVFLLWVVFSSVFASAAMAGNLDSPGLPSAGSGMYTLQGLYDYLLSGVTPSLSGVFLEPSAGPGSTGKTTKEIYDGISAAFNAADATPDKVLSGSTFFSTDPVNWGPRAGTLATQTPVNTTVSQAAGFYNAFDLSAVDTDLAAGNIKSGMDLFGVIGTVIQASGAATDADVLIGVTYSNASGSSTGTMPNNGAVSITPWTTAQSIAAGYHTGSGAVAGDANLATGNIRSGVTIFGVPGSPTVVDTATGTGAASGDLLSGKTAFVNGATVTGVVPAGSSVTGASGSLSMTIPNGLYSGTETATAVDANLITGNIKSGVTIFGVSGKTEVVDTTTATPAAAGDIRSGKTGFVNGTTVSGTLPTSTLSNASTTVNAGYYDATTLETVDSDLSAGNIKSGVNIFGVTGSYNGVECSGTLSALGRWCDNGDGTVTDMNSGLVWLKDAGCVGSMVWADSVVWASILYDGSTAFGTLDCGLADGSAEGDWRLPTRKEFIALTTGTEDVLTGSPYFFANIQSTGYWASNTDASLMTYAWRMVMFSGGEGLGEKTIEGYYVWPVRDGQ